LAQRPLCFNLRAETMPCSRETTAWRSDAPSRDERRLTRTRRRNQKVINFLINCGNKNLQYLLVPSRLDKALAEMDTDRDGHIDIDEWCASASEPLGSLRRGDGVLVA